MKKDYYNWVINKEKISKVSFIRIYHKYETKLKYLMLPTALVPYTFELLEQLSEAHIKDGVNPLEISYNVSKEEVEQAIKLFDTSNFISVLAYKKGFFTVNHKYKETISDYARSKFVSSSKVVTRLRDLLKKSSKLSNTFAEFGGGVGGLKGGGYFTRSSAKNAIEGGFIDFRKLLLFPFSVQGSRVVEFMEKVKVSEEDMVVEVVPTPEEPTEADHHEVSPQQGVEFELPTSYENEVKVSEELSNLLTQGGIAPIINPERWQEVEVPEEVVPNLDDDTKIAYSLISKLLKDKKELQSQLDILQAKVEKDALDFANQKQLDKEKHKEKLGTLKEELTKTKEELKTSIDENKQLTIQNNALKANIRGLEGKIDRIEEAGLVVPFEKKALDLARNYLKSHLDRLSKVDNLTDEEKELRKVMPLLIQLFKLTPLSLDGSKVGSYKHLATWGDSLVKTDVILRVENNHSVHKFISNQNMQSALARLGLDGFLFAPEHFSGSVFEALYGLAELNGNGNVQNFLLTLLVGNYDKKEFVLTL